MVMMLKSGHNFIPVSIDGWYDCGKPETLLETNRYILKKKRPAYRTPGCAVIEPVYISPRAKVSNSIIGPYASIGDGVTMDYSIVSDSIINENAVIMNMNLNRSLVGPSATIIGRREQINIGESSEIRFDKSGCDQ
jgi:glucose-1-phosphate thymidylyltransferase